MNAKTLAVTLVALALPALACGKPQPKTPPAVASAKPVAPAPPAEVHEKVVPHVCAARAKVAQLLGQKREVPMVPMDQHPRVANALRYFSSDVAADEALGSLPDPFTASRSRFRPREVKGIASSTIVETEGATSSILIDVDHDTEVPAKDPDYPKIVADGKFDAEVAIVHRGSGDNASDWVFYDTDADGKMDLVLFVPASGKGAPVQAFRVTKDASAKSGFALQADPALVAGKPFRHKTVFKDKTMGPKWKAIAAKMFKSSLIEE